MLGSNKKSVQILLTECYKYGIRNVIISPGSRNAPLILSFANNNNFKCYSIPDERCAGFYALGMAKQLQQPVAVVCTSGTALLNYAPSIAEAYYQEVPIIILSADRPNYLIEQEDGQTIKQPNIFNNYIKHSVSLFLDEEQKHDENQTLIEQALSKAIGSVKAPVHINMPFDEPIYETENYEFQPKNLKIKNSINNVDYSYLHDAWNKSEKVLLVAGFMHPNTELNNTIDTLIKQKNVVVIAGCTSNIKNNEIIDTPDLFINNLSETQKQALKPDLLLTIGNAVISKSLKIFLRKNKPKYHIDIDPNPKEINTYNALTNKITSSYKDAIDYINNNLADKNSSYKDGLTDAYKKIHNTLQHKLQNIPFCDLLVYDTVFKTINTDINLHLANSTPVRYAEIFKTKAQINYFANRGTSGIDGCTSTAIGSAIVSKKPTMLITGDISFFYDSNALWNKHLPNNFKIILINNGGGNIFRILKGSNNSNQLELFETPQQINAQKICETFNVQHFKAHDKTSFSIELNKLLNENTCSLVEVFLPSTASAEVYKDILNIK